MTKEESLANLKKWCDENPERVKECRRKYYREHRDEINERAKEWQRNHKERAKETQRRWQKNNRARANERARNFGNCILKKKKNTKSGTSSKKCVKN